MKLERAEDHLALVADLTRSLFAPSVAVAVRDPRRMPHMPDPSEARAIAGAIPQRQTEFHAGRAAAREAMVALGLPPRPVPAGPDRAPVWPAGLVGSITHDAEACIAVLGHATDWRALGIDLEADSPLAADLVAEVCTPDETDWLNTRPSARRGLLAKLIFCAKEACYKAQFPLTARLFGFDHLMVEIDEAKASFTARFVKPAGEFAIGQTIEGRYVHAAGVLICGVALSHADATPDATAG